MCAGMGQGWSFSSSLGYGVDDGSVTPMKQKEGKLESQCFPPRPSPGPTVCSLEICLGSILLKLRFLLSSAMRGMEDQSVG